MVNQEISRLFGLIADALEFKGENRFRILAYRRGSEAVADLDEDVSVLVAEARLTEVPGIGKGLAADIAEYLSRNRMSAYETALAGVPRTLLELKGVSGLGPKRLALLHRELAITDLAGLERAIEEDRVAGVPGFGPKLVESLRRGVQRYVQSRERMTLGEALRLSREVLDRLGREVDTRRAVFAGSLRRCRETCGDLDLLIPSRKGGAVVAAFSRLDMVERVLAAGETKGSVLVDGGRQVDLRVVPADSLGAALCYFTGSKEHNVRLREIAKKRGLKINEYGVFRGEERIAGKTEKEVYAALDLPWIPPEMRENRGEIEAARNGTLPEALRFRQLRGDLHVHTSWSNGRDPVQDIVRAAAERGHHYLALTDHAASALHARGLTPERWEARAAEIERARREIPGVRVLHGLEVDIDQDGGIDLFPEAAARAEWIVAGVHAGFRNEVTARMLRAMDRPEVDAIVHPTGRLVDRRAGYEGFDLDAVLEKAARTGVCLELNADPDRLDLSAEEARRAAARGVRVLVSSGAHGASDLDRLELGAGLARRGWLTRGDVVNTGPLRSLRRKR